VCFHGFVAPHEWHPFYTSFFIVLILSLSERLSLFPGHRPLRSLKAEFQDLEFFQPLGIFSGKKFPFVIENPLEGHIQDSDLKMIYHQIDNNFFVIPRTESLWKSAVDYFQQGNYHNLMLLIFPALEHCLRRMFVCTNNCAEKALTAGTIYLFDISNIIENDTLYTTLDVQFKHLVSLIILVYLCRKI
jgi:hypothetical protein